MINAFIHQIINIGHVIVNPVDKVTDLVCVLTVTVYIFVPSDPLTINISLVFNTEATY